MLRRLTRLFCAPPHSGALREEVFKLAKELESLARAKDGGEKDSAAALADHAKKLSGAMEELKALEASVEARNKIISRLESQVNNFFF